MFHPGSLAILPEDGRDIYFEAFDAARRDIRIEICVLEDPLILQSLKQAIDRGVRVRVIVDKGKYEALPSEQANLAAYLTGAGAQLHLSNPTFPKVILVDERYALIGSACLDTTTFAHYRDYAYVSDEPGIIKDLLRLFENDWLHSAKPGQPFPTYNPTPVITQPNLLVSPVNSAYRLVSLIQKSPHDTGRHLGIARRPDSGKRARSRRCQRRPSSPDRAGNGKRRDSGHTRTTSVLPERTQGSGHSSSRHPPAGKPGITVHARPHRRGRREACLPGSISLSPVSTTYNREVGLILGDEHFVRNCRINLKYFNSKSQAY